MARRAWRRAAVTVVATLCVSACGSSGVQYVKNGDRGLYLKLPDSWTTFDVSVEDRPDAVVPERPWQVVFDSADDPSVEHLRSEAPADVVGVVEVVPLTGTNPRERINLSYLRARAVDPEGSVDPLAEVQNGNDRIEIIDYEQLETDDGYWGTRLELNVRTGQGEGDFISIAHIAMVDPGLDYLYRLQVICTSSCYEANKTSIRRVLDSWTIEERST